MNTQIEITENGTTTLATAGKYCDRNIDVNVDVSSGILNDADALAQGTISGEYVSDKVTSLRQYAFDSCANLSSVSLPNCTSVATAAFRGCSALESVNLPSCVSFDGGSVFDGAAKMKTVNIPNLTTIENGVRCFAICNLLEELNAPNLTSVKTNTAGMFNACKKLRKVNCPKLSGMTIQANMFYNCYQLTTLILGGSELNPLENVSAFTGTPIANGTGYIYVPDDLVGTYKTATNWAVFADQIKPISELEE
jgi:hypothetical protein